MRTAAGGVVRRERARCRCSLLPGLVGNFFRVCCLNDNVFAPLSRAQTLYSCTYHFRPLLRSIGQGHVSPAPFTHESTEHAWGQTGTGQQGRQHTDSVQTTSPSLRTAQTPPLLDDTLPGYTEATSSDHDKNHGAILTVVTRRD